MYSIISLTPSQQDFLDVITLPYDDETIRNLLSYYKDKDTLIDVDLIEEHLINQPILGVILLFLFFLATSTLVFAFIFIACRALGKCGAKRYQPHPTSGTYYSIHLFIFLISWIVLAASSMYCIFSGISFWNQKVSYQIININHTINIRHDTSKEIFHNIIKRAAFRQPSVMDLFEDSEYEGDFEQISTDTTTQSAFLTVKDETDEGITKLPNLAIRAEKDVKQRIEQLHRHRTIPTEKLQIRPIEKQRDAEEFFVEPKTSLRPIEIPQRPMAELSYARNMKEKKKLNDGEVGIRDPFVSDTWMTAGNEAFFNHHNQPGRFNIKADTKTQLRSSPVKVYQPKEIIELIDEKELDGIARDSLNEGLTEEYDGQEENISNQSIDQNDGEGEIDAIQIPLIGDGKEIETTTEVEVEKDEEEDSELTTMTSEATTEMITNHDMITTTEEMSTTIKEITTTTTEIPMTKPSTTTKQSTTTTQLTTTINSDTTTIIEDDEDDSTTTEITTTTEIPTTTKIEITTRKDESSTTETTTSEYAITEKEFFFGLGTNRMTTSSIAMEKVTEEGETEETTINSMKEERSESNDEEKLEEEMNDASSPPEFPRIELKPSLPRQTPTVKDNDIEVKGADNSDDFLAIAVNPSGREWTDTTRKPVEIDIFPTESLTENSIGSLSEITSSSSLYPFHSLHTSIVIWLSRISFSLLILLQFVIVVPVLFLVVIGSICYVNSYHPMDRSKISEKIGQLIVLLSTVLLFSIPFLLIYVDIILAYCHIHNAVCPMIQYQYQQQMGLILDSSRFSSLNENSIERRIVNKRNCNESLAAMQGLWISCLLFTFSAIPLVFSLFKLSKYYLRMKTEYYWTMSDSYGSIQRKIIMANDSIYGNIYGSLRPKRVTSQSSPPSQPIYAESPIYSDGPIYADGPVYAAYGAYGRI